MGPPRFSCGSSASSCSSPAAGFGVGADLLESTCERLQAAAYAHADDEAGAAHVYEQRPDRNHGQRVDVAVSMDPGPTC
jgi:hypothetical protein